MYRSFNPAPELTPFIECYWSWRIETESRVLEDILPDAAPEFIVHRGTVPFVETESGDWQQQYRAFLYCAAQKGIRISIRGSMELFSIRFRPWGVGAFSQASMAAMLDRPVPPLDSLQELGPSLETALLSAESDERCVDRADRLLTDALQPDTRRSPRLKKLLHAAGGGTCSSIEMAEKLAMSDRSFSRLWNDVVGFQPRRYIQLMRFHKALEMLENGMLMKQVAAECGYSDQAHMARQIKNIAGLPPSALRRRLGNTVYQDLYASRPDAPWHDHAPEPSRRDSE